jgi:hypothetical protein
MLAALGLRERALVEAVAILATLGEVLELLENLEPESRGTCGRYRAVRHTQYNSTRGL